MECDICLTEWDPNKRIPRLLSCGHTFCQECLKQMFNKCKKEKKKFQCPTCNTIQDNLYEEKDILSLINKYNLNFQKCQHLRIYTVQFVVVKQNKL